MNETEEKFEIPKNLRVSTDPGDAEAFARLQEADEQQKELAEKFALMPDTPLKREMSRAKIVIETLGNSSSLTETQYEQLAEAYATIGMYQTAAEHTSDKFKREEYLAIWDAVLLPDENWCEHSDIHKFRKANVFSLSENQELPLLKCNICGMINVTDLPEHLRAASAKRAGVVGSSLKTNSIQDALRWHQQNVK